MKKRILTFFFCVAFLTQNLHSQGFDFLWGAVGTLTGQGLINKLKNAAIAVVEKAENSANSVAVRISSELNKNADNLSKILGDKVDKPLTELRKTFESEIEKSLVAVNQTESFINSLRSCFKNDVKELLNGLEGTLTYNVSNAIPWAKDRPIIMNVKKLGSDAYFGIRVSSDSSQHQILEVSGANFLQSPRCYSEIEIINSNLKDTLEADIVSVNPKSISVSLVSVNKPGVYKMTIKLHDKGVFGCKSAKTAEATFVVLPEAKFEFSYKITPSCSVKQTIAFEAGELHGINDECNGWKTFSQNFVMPSEWKYVSHNWIPTACQECEGGATYSGGNMVTVSYRCPERGGFLCTGARKWIHGKMIIYGEKEGTKLGESVAGKFPSFLKFGQSVSINPISPNNCINNGVWTISVSVKFPDGSIYDIPALTSDTPVSNSLQNGVAFFWNPTTMILTVNAPPVNCGEY
jgi:hypothetical protein